MFKFLNLSVFIVIGFLSSQTYAQKTIKLAPNETKVLANNTLWTVNATCNIQGTNHNGKVRIIVLKHNGTVNGKNLSTGQATQVTVKDKSSISVSAESGTQINLINLGSEGLQAVCSI